MCVGEVSNFSPCSAVPEDNSACSASSHQVVAEVEAEQLFALRLKPANRRGLAVLATVERTLWVPQDGAEYWRRPITFPSLSQRECPNL